MKVLEEFDISKYITAADIVSAVAAGTIAYLTYKTKQDEPKPEQSQQGQQAPQGQQVPQGQEAPTAGPSATGSAPTNNLPSFKSWQDTADAVKQDDRLFKSVAKAAGCWKEEVDGEALWNYAAKKKLTISQVVDLVKKINSTSGNGRWSVLLDKEPGLMDFIGNSNNIQDAIVAYSKAGNTIDWGMMREFGLSKEMQDIIKTNTVDAFRREYTNLPTKLINTLANEVGTGYRSVDALERVANYAAAHPEMADGLTDAIKQSAIGDATTIVKGLEMYARIGKQALGDVHMQRLMKYSPAFCNLLKQIKPGITDINNTIYGAININS